MTIRTILHVVLGLALVLVLSILGGCQIGRYAQNWSRPLVVAPDCPPDVVVALGEAVIEWNRALPEAGLRLATSGPVSVRCNGAPVGRGDHVILAQTFAGGIMQLWLDGVSREQAERALLHELGHYLGAQGEHAHPASGQAMRHARPDLWTCVNRADLEAVCRGRGTLTRQWGCRVRPDELRGTCL